MKGIINWFKSLFVKVYVTECIHDRNSGEVLIKYSDGTHSKYFGSGTVWRNFYTGRCVKNYDLIDLTMDTVAYCKKFNKPYKP